VIVPRIIGIAVGLLLTWMIFFGAGYFGAVWTHYFSGETPPAPASEVSVKVVTPPLSYIGLFCPNYRPGLKCPVRQKRTAPKPHG